MKHCKRLLIGILLLTTFLVNMVAPASAYDYPGYKWNTNYAAYQRDSSVPSSWSSAIDSAASTWNNVGANFSFEKMITQNKIYCTNAGDTYLGKAVPTHSGGYNTRYKMYFNTYFTWSTASGGESGKYDVQSVATHEFGHWLTLYNLYDSTDSEKTMYEWTASNEIKKRTLDSDDIAGINYIYP